MSEKKIDKLYREALANQKQSWTDPNGEEIQDQFPGLREQKPHQCGTSYCRQRFDNPEDLAKHNEDHKQMRI